MIPALHVQVTNLGAYAGDINECESAKDGDNGEDTEMSEAGDDNRDEEQEQCNSTSGCLGLSCGAPQGFSVDV